MVIWIALAVSLIVLFLTNNFWLAMFVGLGPVFAWYGLARIMAARSERRLGGSPD
jgi:hypothetical protein